MQEVVPTVGRMKCRAASVGVEKAWRIEAATVWASIAMHYRIDWFAERRLADHVSILTNAD
jgi:hypothetical protein